MAKTYEMLWDCQFCGTKKLLGKTHRHCPSCGAPQDAKSRYYPSDAEKVAVEDHIYHGADKVCPSCQAPNSAAAQHCGGCGSALAGAKDVALRKDQVGTSFAGETVKDAKREQAEAKAVAAGTPVKAPAKPSKRNKIIAIVGASVAVLAALVVVLTWTREGQVKVTGHSWSREIAIEKYGPKSESAWCDQMPGDAYRVSRSREVRSHNKVPDGEDCHTVREDNGDGTFSESEQCTTKYRDEPVYDDHCAYTVDRWQRARSVVAKGAAVTPAPAWPTVNITRPGTCVGCEREGPRTEKYLVQLVDDKAKSHECDFAQARWAGLQPQSTWTADLGMVTGSLACDSLRAPGAKKTK
jgi:hypothetical protein